jgi:hypothetical protein
MIQREMKHTNIADSVGDIYSSINRIRFQIEKLSHDTDITQDLFDEMYKLAFQMEQGNDIISNRYKVVDIKG